MFADAKASLNISTFTGIYPFQTLLLSPKFRIRCCFSKLGAIQIYDMVLVVPNVFSGAEYCMVYNFLRIVSVSLAVIFNRILECRALVEGIPSKIFNPQKSINIAHFHFGTEFDICVLFSSYNRPYPGLRKTDDPVIYSVTV